MARIGKKLIRHVGYDPIGFSSWRGHSSRKSRIYGGKSRHGKEKLCRLFKQFARENLAIWREDPSWTALPDYVVTFSGARDARDRLIWGIENFKKFRKHGKVMVGDDHGVFMENDEVRAGYALTYALMCRGTWNEPIGNIKFNEVSW